MATPDQVALLRRMIGEPSDVAPWTDQYLSELIDANDGDLNGSALSAWTDKAASYAALVDTTESGSSRRLSQLQEQALKMASYYGAAKGPEGSVDALTTSPYTIQAVRV
jgi:hypothetical protein